VNVTPNVNDIADAGEDGVVETDAPGASTSMFMVDDVVATAGPVRDVTSDVTAS
jgi:hypothetical protein